MLATLLSACTSLSANPIGPNVVNGTANFSSPAPNALNISNSPNAIINWQGFSIQQHEVTRFIQQSANSAVLNRVIGNDLSRIQGQLLSNGRVFLINPHGIVFGPNAVVDTAGFIASTLNMADEDFLQGNLNFVGDEHSGAINNQGLIKAGENGEVLFIAPDIENSGIIETDGGKIILAAGESVRIVSLDDPAIQFDVQSPDNSVVNLGQLLASGGSISAFAGTLSHSGDINADSVTMDAAGNIVLSASKSITLESGSVVSASSENGKGGRVDIAVKTPDDPDLRGTLYQLGDIHADGQAGGDIAMRADSILATGTISADGEATGGTIDIQARGRLLAMDSAEVSAQANNGDGGGINVFAGESLFTSATYDATGNAGGNVKLSGDEVKLADAEIDVSGKYQGGDIRVGGGFKGNESGVANANNTQVNGTTTLTADAIESGDGGTVVVWSDGTSRFSGKISATAGDMGGNGGIAEVSGKQGLGYNGLVDLSASNGDEGSLLLDPKNITITNGPATGGSGYVTTDLLDPNPNASDEFAYGGLLLNSGMLLIAESGDDIAASNAGAVYLFNPDTGALLATLTGSQANDNVGDYGNGLTALTNGNYVVVSQTWDNAGVSSAGAATWGNGTTGVSGAVSAANSLVGSTANNRIGSDGVTALTNGNYVVGSQLWDNGGISDVGAVTWGDGTTGVNGVVSIANSLVGTVINEKIGTGGVTALTNGNYVVSSHLWHDVGPISLGAATWGDGTTGITGNISSANSLVGTSSQDRIAVGNTSNKGVVALSNGNYVVKSYYWNNARGAVTWGDGTTGITGTVSAANSLIGSVAFDSVGGGGVTPLSNGNYVVNAVTLRPT